MNMDRRPSLVVAMTATNRLEMLHQSVQSLSMYVAPFFQLKLLVHHDDVYGELPTGMELNDAVASALTEETPTAAILGPRGGPSHGAAIRRLWSHPNLPHDGYFLHWEDDFVAKQPLLPQHLVELRRYGAGMGALCYPELTGNAYATYVRDSSGRPRLGTSPRFVHGAFARRYASLVDPSLCPEKQTYLEVCNADWQRFIRFGHAGHPAEALILRAVGNDPFLIEHQGEDWNRRNGVTRRHVGARVLRTDAQGRSL